MEAVKTLEKEEKPERTEFLYRTFIQEDETGRPVNIGPAPWSFPVGQFLYCTFIQPMEGPQPPQVESEVGKPEEYDFHYRTLDEEEEEKMRPHLIEAKGRESDRPEFQYRTLGRPEDEERAQDQDIETQEDEPDQP